MSWRQIKKSWNWRKVQKKWVAVNEFWVHERCGDSVRSDVVKSVPYSAEFYISPLWMWLFRIYYVKYMSKWSAVGRRASWPVRQIITWSVGAGLLAGCRHWPTFNISLFKCWPRIAGIGLHAVVSVSAGAPVGATSVRYRYETCPIKGLEPWFEEPSLCV